MRYTRTWHHSRQHDNVCVFLIFVVLCYVHIHITTDASTLSTSSGTFQPRLATGTAQCHIPSYSYIALLSAALSEQHPCHIAWAPVYPLLLSSQDSVDADVDQALIPPSIYAPEGTRGGYATWQLMMSEEGFRLHKTCTGESATISIYLV